MIINPNIFKAYDIRGVYPEEINEETVYSIGRAIVTFTKAETIVVGKDIRLSSDALEKELIKGITDQGANVIKIGLSTSPMLYYASGLLAIDVGVIITASHNPAEYNGLKLCLKNAVPIGEGTGMEEIKALAVNQSFTKPEKTGKVAENADFQKHYIKHTKRFFNIQDASKDKNGHNR